MHSLSLWMADHPTKFLDSSDHHKQRYGQFNCPLSRLCLKIIEKRGLEVLGCKVTSSSANVSSHYQLRFHPIDNVFSDNPRAVSVCLWWPGEERVSGQEICDPTNSQAHRPEQPCAHAAIDDGHSCLVIPCLVPHNDKNTSDAIICKNEIVFPLKWIRDTRTWNRGTNRRVI